MDRWAAVPDRILSPLKGKCQLWPIRQPDRIVQQPNQRSGGVNGVWRREQEKDSMPQPGWPLRESAWKTRPQSRWMRDRTADGCLSLIQ
jgi:hypothetical protein